MYLRKNETPARVGVGFGVSTATAGRYVIETVEILADQAPNLHDALASVKPWQHVIVDGTLIPINRVAADEPYYSQKHKRHGMNVQVIATANGTPLWFSRALPGRTHDLTAARAHGIVQACLTRQIFVLADKAYQGAHAPSAPPARDANYPIYTGSSTEIMRGYELPASGPSPASSSGGSSARLDAVPAESGAPSPLFTPSRSPGAQDEKCSVYKVLQNTLPAGAARLRSGFRK